MKIIKTANYEEIAQETPYDRNVREVDESMGGRLQEPKDNRLKEVKELVRRGYSISGALKIFYPFFTQRLLKNLLI